MSNVTKPQGRISIGWAVINGQRVPVTIDLEWDRYLQFLTAQTNANSANALIGAQGAAGASVMGMDFDGGDVEFIPGPRGDKGDKGEPGPALFMLDDPIENDVYWPITG